MTDQKDFDVKPVEGEVGRVEQYDDTDKSPLDPIVPYDLEPNFDVMMQWPDGSVRPVMNFGLGEYDLWRVENGYGCMRCLLVFARKGLPPFPERCPDCGYEVAEKQRRDFLYEFRGERYLGPVRALEMIKNNEPIPEPKRHISVPRLPGEKQSAGGVVLPKGVGRDAS